MGHPTLPRLWRSGLALTLLAVTLGGLAGCTTVVSLTYTPTRPVLRGPPASISGVTARDATVRQPYVLLDVPNMNGIRPIAYTRGLVADEVAAVFTTALQVRGMVAASAPHQIRLTMWSLGGHTSHDNHILDGPLTDAATAYIHLDLAVTDQSGRTIYKDTVEDGRELKTLARDRDDGRLPVLVQALLNTTVDRMLDNPAFRAALSRR